jgi:hypothetical protein
LHCARPSLVRTLTVPLWTAESSPPGELKSTPVVFAKEVLVATWGTDDGTHAAAFPKERATNSSREAARLLIGWAIMVEGVLLRFVRCRVKQDRDVVISHNVSHEIDVTGMEHPRACLNATSCQTLLPFPSISLWFN